MASDTTTNNDTISSAEAMMEQVDELVEKVDASIAHVTAYLKDEIEETSERLAENTLLSDGQIDTLVDPPIEASDAELDATASDAETLTEPVEPVGESDTDAGVDKAIDAVESVTDLIEEVEGLIEETEEAAPTKEDTAQADAIDETAEPESITEDSPPVSAPIEEVVDLVEEDIVAETTPLEPKSDVDELVGDIEAAANEDAASTEVAGETDFTDEASAEATPPDPVAEVEESSEQIKDAVDDAEVTAEIETTPADEDQEETNAVDAAVDEVDLDAEILDLSASEEQAEPDSTDDAETNVPGAETATATDDAVKSNDVATDEAIDEVSSGANERADQIDEAGATQNDADKPNVDTIAAEKSTEPVINESTLEDDDADTEFDIVDLDALIASEAEESVEADAEAVPMQTSVAAEPQDDEIAPTEQVDATPPPVEDGDTQDKAAATKPASESVDTKKTTKPSDKKSVDSSAHNSGGLIRNYANRLFARFPIMEQCSHYVYLGLAKANRPWCVLSADTQTAVTMSIWITLGLGVTACLIAITRMF